MINKKIRLAAVLVLSGLTHAAIASDGTKPSENALTPWGAIKAANKDKTIPAYDGGLPVSTAPKGFVPDSGRWPDPFADEKPLYSITAKNMDQHADKLTEVSKELLKRFPTYRMDVYPTHRVVNYPRSFIENSMKNAERCKTIENGLAVENCFGGVPFPVPKDGYEQMWNVQLAFKRPTLVEDGEQFYVDSTGNPVVSGIQNAGVDSPYHNTKSNLEAFYGDGAYIARGYAVFKYPSRVAGENTMSMFVANPVKNNNKAWNYQPGNRRVRAIPDAQYDYPTPVSGGAQFFDELFMFTGKMDRFDFKLVGVKEILIPYNTQRTVYSSKEALTSVGNGRHPNPDLIRWELHRVRVVEATLKPGKRHAFSKRRYYLDEDFPQAGITDTWDHAGKLYKSYMNLFYWAYDKQAPMAAASLEIDLATGVWFMNSQLASSTSRARVVDRIPDTVFTPEGMTRISTR